MIALLLFAALLFWLLPRIVSAPSTPPLAQTAPIAAPSTPAPVSVASAAPAALATPAWEDPALLQARAAAQAAKARFESALTQLRSHDVERWGAQALAQAEAHAAAGAAAFAAKTFADAQREYEAAASDGDALLASVEPRLKDAMAAGQRALEAGDKPAAQAAYALAQALDPDNAQARRGLERVATFDALRAKLDTARRLEQAGDPAGARAAWNEALALDADSQAAREGLARLDAQTADDAFARALGAALAAMDRGGWDEAERQLAAARKQHAQDPALQQASARLAEARRVQQLAALEREAAAQAAEEDWAGAVASYRRALQLDPSLSFAREGLAQAEPRAALAQRMQETIARPERLASAAVMDEATVLLAQARAITNPGPRHREQVLALARAIAGAATPIAVTLRSDGLTEVTLYKIGTLGRFATHELQLKPGRYVAVGSRKGYRDVREEFEIAAGATSPSVDIRCQEPL